MSWGIQKATKGSEIVAAFAEGGKSYTEPKTQRILAAIQSLVAELAEGHDEHFVTVDTQGHVDAYAGSGAVTIRIWPKA